MNTAQIQQREADLAGLMIKRNALIVAIREVSEMMPTYERIASTNPLTLFRRHGPPLALAAARAVANRPDGDEGSILLAKMAATEAYASSMNIGNAGESSIADAAANLAMAAAQTDGRRVVWHAREAWLHVATARRFLDMPPIDPWAYDDELAALCSLPVRSQERIPA